MDPDLLRRRIEHLYQVTTGATSAHGAQRWFARQARVHGRTVRRWLAGEHPPEGPVMALLDCLEQHAGID